jgi:DNA repair protein RecO
MVPVPLRVRVLRHYPLGETSLIVVMFSEEQGLLRAVAKGARGQKSPFRGLLEPGTALDVLVHIKARGGLHLLREARGRRTLPRPARRLETLSLRLAALELVMSTTQEGEALAGLFPLLEEYLELFVEVADPGWAPLFAFEAGLLALHGLEPSLEQCGLCERPLAGTALRFLPGEGLFACPDHENEGLDLAPEERDWLLSIFLARPAALAGREMPASARSRIGRVLHLALGRHLPGYKLPRSLAMLGQAKRGEGEARADADHDDDDRERR